MRATRAYIASAGTAVLMLGASVCAFVLVSAFVAFGSWPGAGSYTDVDQIVLGSVQEPQVTKVTVRRDAVAVAKRRAERAAELAAPVVHGGVPVTRAPGIARPGTSDQPASAPSAQGNTGARAPSTPTGVQLPDIPGATRQVSETTQQLTNATRQVTENLATQVNQVQQQVNEVVDQIVGGDVVGGVNNTVGTVGKTVDSTVQTVDSTVKTVTGAVGSLLGGSGG
jgi:hypothetical protein